jgi:hypothetical protein
MEHEVSLLDDNVSEIREGVRGNETVANFIVASSQSCLVLWMATAERVHNE